jgi:pimeloyl-ACP methyl ester carboxylesterase
MKAIVRGYAGAGGAQLHYRELGQGLPVILLHASPLSSAFMLGQLRSLASAGFRAIALDRRELIHPRNCIALAASLT